jgi:hypothetical protein
MNHFDLGNLFSFWESVGTANESLEIHDGFRRIYQQGVPGTEPA